MPDTPRGAMAVCSCSAVQDRASMDRSRPMKMAAVAGKGDDQVRIEGSIAHDPAVGNDSFLCESLILLFLVYCECSWVQNLRALTSDGVQGSLS